MPKADLSHYRGREPAYIKHCLLEKYLPDLAYKVGSKWSSLAYIDGFAGPWKTTTPNYDDSSFGIAVDTLRRCQAGLRERSHELHLNCILVDRNDEAFAQLEKFAREKTKPDFEVHALPGDFVENIPSIERILGKNSGSTFRFVFLDPKGWADIPMLKLRSFLQSRGCEVLINLMTRHIVRFLDEPSREDSYNNLFGRTEVLSILRDASMQNAPSFARAERAVREYGRSLKLLCNFKYVSSAVVLEPDKESIRYFLVYASNHPTGVEVFKAAENQSAKIQETVRHETQIQKTKQPPLAFDDLPVPTKLSIQLHQFYSGLAKGRVIEFLLANQPREGFSYSSIFCEAMAFPLVTPNDLVHWLKSFEPNIKIVLENPKAKKLSPSRDDRIFVTDREALRLC
jgi:three-Cys-motif partner protein